MVGILFYVYLRINNQNITNGTVPNIIYFPNILLFLGI
jgi:hypothetical protein